MKCRWLCSVFALKSVQLDLSGPWFGDGWKALTTQQCPGPKLGTEQLFPGHTVSGTDFPIRGADSDPDSWERWKGLLPCLLALEPTGQLRQLLALLWEGCGSKCEPGLARLAPSNEGDIRPLLAGQGQVGLWGSAPTVGLHSYSLLLCLFSLRKVIISFLSAVF